MKEQATKQVSQQLLKRAVEIVKDDGIPLTEKKRLIKELKEEKKSLIKIL